MIEIVQRPFAVAVLLAASLACPACRDSTQAGGAGRPSGAVRQSEPPGLETPEPDGDPARTGPAGPAIRLRSSDAREGKSAFEVVGLSETELATLTQAQPSRERWSHIFAVYVENAERPSSVASLPILGSHLIDDKVVRFEPQFPLEPGLGYRAVYEYEYDLLLSSGGAAPQKVHLHTGPITAHFSIPKPAPAATTSLTQVYPSAAELPENTLKFYLHFSAPMSRGEAYKRIHLLNESDKEVDLPFLELDEELWDPSGTRFTLFFDPGRIKRGLKPREELGPVLEEGKSYTLVIDRDWPDAAGNPLSESVRKRFRVGPPDDAQPDPKTWKVNPPAVSSTDPLVLVFPEPLDHAMLQRVIGVADSEGTRIAGTVAIAAEETRWQFTPVVAWRPGDYSLVVQTTLEDLAGNSIARVFDVDLLEPISRHLKAETVRVPFRIGPTAEQ